jgi:hypothetical protein
MGIIKAILLLMLGGSVGFIMAALLAASKRGDME